MPCRYKSPDKKPWCDGGRRRYFAVRRDQIIVAAKLHAQSPFGAPLLSRAELPDMEPMLMRIPRPVRIITITALREGELGRVVLCTLSAVQGDSAAGRARPDREAEALMTQGQSTYLRLGESEQRGSRVIDADRIPNFSWAEIIVWPG